MCESENLIMSVEKYPCLWDTNNTDYHNREMKEMAWEQICQEMFYDWDVSTDKASKCAELKKKWTNIRDYYRREVQKTKTGSGAKKSKKYIYGELLYFLTPVFEKRGSDANYSNDEEISDCKLITHENEELDEIEETYLEPRDSSPPPEGRKRKRKADSSRQLLNILQKRHKATEEDDDTKFLLSFRNYMKQMNTYQKIDFKMGMLGLVKKTLIDPLQPSDMAYCNVDDVKPEIDDEH